MWGERNSGLPNSSSEGDSKTRIPQHQVLHKTTMEWGRDGKVLPMDAGGAACLVPSGASFGADRCPHFGLCFHPRMPCGTRWRDLHERRWREEGNASRQSHREGLKGGESHLTSLD